ncbi:hypothetical protein V8C44DRAFT_323765 [Trichoderma aethiopicum]
MSWSVGVVVIMPVTIAAVSFGLWGRVSIWRRISFVSFDRYRWPSGESFYMETLGCLFVFLSCCCFSWLFVILWAFSGESFLFIGCLGVSGKGFLECIAGAFFSGELVGFVSFLTTVLGFFLRVLWSDGFFGLWLCGFMSGLFFLWESFAVLDSLLDRVSSNEYC